MLCAEHLYRVAAYCTCENFDLAETIDHLEANKGFKGSMTLYTDVLYIKHKKKQADIFVFSYGCVAFFNMQQTDEEGMRRCCIRTQSPALFRRVTSHSLVPFAPACACARVRAWCGVCSVLNTAP